MLRMRIALLILLGLLAVGLAVGNAGTAQAQVDHYHVVSTFYEQTAGVSFTVTITARDPSDNISAENVTVTLSSTPATVVFDTDSDSLFDDTTAELVDGIVDISAKITLPTTSALTSLMAAHQATAPIPLTRLLLPDLR